MEILLVEIHKTEEIWNGLGVGYLASFIRKKGHSAEIKLLHFGSNIDDFVRQAKERQYPIIGFSASFYNSFDFALNIIVRLKKDGINSHIVMGGHTPTSCYEKVMTCFPEVDSMVLGEGELTFLELIEKFNEKDRWKEIDGLIFRMGEEIILNPPRKLIKDLDEIPFPVRKKHVHRELEMDIPELKRTFNYALKSRMMVTTSRGCYGRCSFCSVYHFYNYNVRRGRSVENVVNEIEDLVNNYDARVIAFNDDNFFDPCDKENKWYYRFADELEKRKVKIIFNFQCRPNDVDYNLFARLKEVGLHYVFIGTESFIPRTLRLFSKGLKVETNFRAVEILSKLDIDYQTGLIVFEPFTTFEEVKESLRCITSLYDNYNYSSPLWIDTLRIYYGTKIQKMLEQKNMLEGQFPYYSYTIEDRKVETLCNIIINSAKEYTESITEIQTMLAPQAGNLLFLWGINYLKDLPSVNKEEIIYLPKEKLKNISIESSRLFLSLIYKSMDVIESNPSEKEIEDIISYFKIEYGKENERILQIIRQDARKR